MDGEFTPTKTKELWEAVLLQPIRKKLRLMNMYTSNQIAVYVIKTTVNSEYMAMRFRRAGARYVSVTRIWGTNQLRVTVCRFVAPLKPFTDKDFDDLVIAYAANIQKGEPR